MSPKSHVRKCEGSNLLNQPDDTMGWIFPTPMNEREAKELRKEQKRMFYTGYGFIIAFFLFVLIKTWIEGGF